MTLHTYLPQDRLRSLARGETLPDRTSGAALFVDISGFTALTESLRESLGPRQGAEELTKQLSAVYSALIAEVEKYSGSVIGFAGDAMMCWFDDKDEEGNSSSRALVSAFGMQRAIDAFPELGLKVAITSGDARRFVVGDSEIQRLDALAGGIVARASTAELHAVKGELLVDEATTRELGDSLIIQEWRNDENSGERFAVISKYSGSVAEAKIEAVDSLSPDVLKSMVHHAVFERETSKQGTFLTEFRPCVALFVRFTGIDYDSAYAESELNAFIRQVQSIVSRYEGVLLQLTIGDKGSYAYINFGALSMHENDSKRAVKTAWELMKASSLQLQMGITQGLMRVGAYGGATRKQYGALGDDVNLAARLMTTAKAGEILVSGHVHKAVMNQFTFEPRTPLPMKGKSEPLPVFAVTGERQQRAIRLQEPTYTLPMVGRTQELQVITNKLDLAAHSQGQVIGIVAEAGLGKSRLVAEVIRSARRTGFVGYGGACQSDGIHAPYLAWKSIWQAFFDVDPDMPERKLIRWLEGEIEDRAPDRVEAMPLLNALLDLNLPENNFTKNLEPKIRQSALHALLEDCLKAAAKDDPLIIVMEDLHWIDAPSHDLLERLAMTLTNYPVCFVIAYRPPQLERLQSPRLEALPQFTRVELHELSKDEAESTIRAKLAQLYPARDGSLPGDLVNVLMARSQGNPFYIEELLNYVRDRGLDPFDLQRIELPDSLHTLILSRIDQLSEQEKTTLRVASIIGRLFHAAWLNGYYPELGSMPQVKVVLDQLDELDITSLDSEPELTYIFKHIVTHEVTYESLLFATRAKLHEQLALYLESIVGPSHDSPLLDTITFHYLHSENKEKQREYLRKAGEAAQRNFANDAALEYYGKLLPLLTDGKEQTEIYSRRGQVLELMGRYAEAEHDYRSALDSAKHDMAAQADAQFALGKLNRLHGDYEPALEWLARAKQVRTELQDTVGLTKALIETGMVLWRKGDYAQAREPLNEGLALARQTEDKLNTAQALNGLGLTAWDQGDYLTARAMYESSLALRREMGDKYGIASSLNNLGLLVSAQGDYTAARSLYQESLELLNEMGLKYGIASSLNNLGLVVLAQGKPEEAQALYHESLVLWREMGDKYGVAITIINLGLVALVQNETSTSRALLEESLAMCQEMDDKTNMAYALLGLGMVDLAENKREAREHILHSLRLRQETGEQSYETSSLIGVAGLALYERNPQFAVQLLGAVESALKRLNAVIEPEMIHFYAQTLAAARKQLGGSAFQSAWEEGSKWLLEEAVKKALKE